MPPGYLLRNRYRIEHRLAAGGFGETYIAIDEDYPNKRRVVVKHLKPQSNDPVVLETARRLFDTEGVTLANLGDKTDRIPTLYAYFEEDREFYLVQEWIEGQTLTQELATRKLSEAETLEVVREILAVLIEVHTKRIVHRDLKPDNIIRRSRDRQLVLIDFGAVKAVRQTTLMATNIAQSVGIGTEGYMPSEQARGYPTSASDIYAVGAIALQCLTGQPPSKLFDQYGLEWRWRHLCKVSDRVANILTKMVAERHLDRYPHAMAAITAIDSLLAPVPPSPSIPTIQSQPTPVPPAQPQQPKSPKPSPPAIKATAQAFQSICDRIERIDVTKWAKWGFAGLIGLSLVSILINKLAGLAVDPLSTSQTSESNNATSAEQKSKNGDYQGALADYNRAIKLQPKNSNLYNNRGLLKSDKLQDYQGALADYDLAIKFDSDDASAYGNRGFLKHQELDDPQGALSDYNLSIKLDSTSAAVYNNRASLKYGKLQDYQGSLADYNQAIKLDPDNSTTYNSRGFLKCVKLEDYQGALADYSQAIKLDPNHAGSYYSRSLIKNIGFSDRTGAIEDMKQAALLYQKQGNKEGYEQATAQIKNWSVPESSTPDDLM